LDGSVKTITTPLIILGLLLAPVLGVGIWARVRGTATNYAEAGLIGLSIAFGFFWLRRNPWLEAKLLPSLRKRVSEILAQ
jgi:hypothetical protein